MRLGLDIGTNSIGWWLYGTDGGRISEVMDGGVRIFSDGRDPKTKASLAVDRRAARAQRRRRDRYLRRKAALMKRMAQVGLMPGDPSEAKALEVLDPYELRARGLDSLLPLTHFGRALFHLNQRRGFNSNRKTDRGDNESGKIKDATARLDQVMMAKGARTYGEFLHMRRAAAPDPKNVPSVRTRLTVAQRDDAEKEEVGYDFYPDRKHLSEEFDKLWAAQAQHAPDVLTDDLRDEIAAIIFHQRPLKTPEVGLCLFTGQDGVPERDKRIPSAHPLNQRRILMETVNNLKVSARGERSRALTREERDRILFALDNKNLRNPHQSPRGMGRPLLSSPCDGKLNCGLRKASHWRQLTAMPSPVIRCVPACPIPTGSGRGGRPWIGTASGTWCSVFAACRVMTSTPILFVGLWMFMGWTGTIQRPRRTRLCPKVTGGWA